MEYLIYARKFRPQTFKEVVGQETITTTLKNAIRQERVPQRVRRTSSTDWAVQESVDLATHCGGIDVGPQWTIKRHAIDVQCRQDFFMQWQEPLF